MKRIGLVTSADPFNNKGAWSGTIYKIREALQMAGYEVVWISYDITTFRLPTKVYHGICHLIEWITRKKIIGWVHSPYNSWRFAKAIDKGLVESCDYLFFPGGAQVGVFMRTHVPIIYYTDATAHIMFEYYWKKVGWISRKLAILLEEKACRKAWINIRASDWAANSVINDCHCDCHVIEFGPNLYSKDIRPGLPFSGGQFNMIFIGADWERKGGNIAVEVLSLIRDNGIDAFLHIVGPTQLPEGTLRKCGVVFHGNLNKNVPSDYQKLITLYNHSHLLILPTQAEAAGIVFCEATGFGIPSYTYATGGTPNYVINGINGRTLALGSKAEVFARLIIEDIQEKRFRNYRENALRLYKEKLSWEAWGSRLNELIASKNS